MKPLRPEDFQIVPFEDASPLLADHAALRRRADELGYLYLKQLLPESLVEPVRRFVRQYCLGHGWVQPAEGNPTTLQATPGARLDGRGWDDARFVELQLQLAAHQGFQALGQYPAILQILEAICGQPMWMATTNYCWVKFPGSPEHTTRPHQDSFYLPGCPSLWTGWVPLVDTPLDVGPLGVVPGSSHRGDWPHIDALTGIDAPRETTWATGEVKAGDLVLFATRTVHCAWSNVSPTQVRLSLDVRYEARPVEGGTGLRPLPDGLAS
jgi:ectoine hydroxylase-related dioxygenase (phytanoyl-CoA dioxygenase family)